MPLKYANKDGFTPQCKCGHALIHHFLDTETMGCSVLMDAEKNLLCACHAFSARDGRWVETGHLWWKRGHWEPLKSSGLAVVPKRNDKDFLRDMGIRE